MTAADRFDEGIIFFNQGKYYEAHEAWEDVWRGAEPSAKRFYQGLVHAAVGMYHLGRNNTTGAAAQLAKSVRNLLSTSVVEAGIDVAGLIAQLRRVQEVMQPSEVRIARLK